jgi:hypothetical protein
MRGVGNLRIGRDSDPRYDPADWSSCPFRGCSDRSRPDVDGEPLRPEEVFGQGYPVSSVTNSSRVFDRQLNVSVLVGGSPTGR